MDQWMLPGAAMVSVLALYWYYTTRRRYPVKDKIVLITGASSGIGRAAGALFYKAGARLILASRSEANLNNVKKQLMASGKGHEPDILPIDIGDYSSIQKAAEIVLKKYSKVDILINNAGQSFRGAAISTAINVHEHLMKVNYFGQIALTQALLPAMIANGGGDIVAVSSVQGKLYVPFRTAYSASKHALECYFDTLRAEHFEDHIRVVICCPGYTKTDLSYKAMIADGSNYGKMDKSLEEGMPPERIAEAILKAVERGTKHVIVAPFHHRLACYFPNLFWNVMAYIMRKKAQTDPFRPGKTD